MPDRLSFRIASAPTVWVAACVVACMAFARAGWAGPWLVAGLVWSAAIVEELLRLPLPRGLDGRDHAYRLLGREAIASLATVAVVSGAPVLLAARGLLIDGGVLGIVPGVFHVAAIVAGVALLVWRIQTRVRFVSYVLDALESVEAGERRHTPWLTMVVCAFVTAVFVAVVHLRLRPVLLDAAEEADG